MIANDQNIIQHVKDAVDMFRNNFTGNVKHLGTFHGANYQVNREIEKICIKLQRKLLHIELINDGQVKLKLFIKFLSYNKAVFLLKTTRMIDKWLDEINKIYKYA